MPDLCPEKRPAGITDTETLKALLQALAAEPLSDSFLSERLPELQRILAEQSERYPAMTEQDVQKLCFQSLFGGGHLIADEAACFNALKAEWLEITSDGHFHAPAAAEPIGGGHCRFPLCAVSSDKQDGGRPADSKAANGKAANGKEAAKTSQVKTDCKQTKTDYKQTKLEAQLRALCRLFAASASLTQKRNQALSLSPALPPVHHSEAFRAAYRPAYRVLRCELLPLLLLLSAIEFSLSRQKLTVLAIDGMCGAGKTSLAAFLHSVYGCSIIHADDFFLPPELRTDERLHEPGGNIHYERLQEEVISPLLQLKKKQQKKKPEMEAKPSDSASQPHLCYRRFSCSRMAYEKEPVSVSLTPLLIVEGSYCQRPEFREAYDLCIFLSCSEETQKTRILNRNGAEMLRAFQEKWIPMETRYFSYFQIPAHADFRFS